MLIVKYKSQCSLSPCLYLPLHFLFLFCVGSVAQRHHHLYVVTGEQSGLAVHGPLEPVLVYMIGQRDDVALVEAELSVVLRFKVVQSLAAGLICRYGDQRMNEKREDKR